MADKGPIRKHYYHAEAAALRGDLKLPHPAKIERQAHARVKPEGGYESQQGKPFRVEGIVSYCAAHTQAAGHLEDQEQKPDRGFKTLTSSLVEGLNILNVVTADRVVAQVSTEHPLYESDGHVPKVTFLGTQFQNLRIGGYLVEVELDLDLLDGDNYSGKESYTCEGFFGRLKARFDAFRQGEDANALATELNAQRGDGKESTELSLVKSIKTRAPWPHNGNVFDIPHFGQVRLGVVRIEHKDYVESVPQTTVINVSMIEAIMGCIASGTVQCCVGKSNGGTVPGGG